MIIKIDKYIDLLSSI